MTRKQRYEYIISYFEEKMPTVTTELEYGSVFQLLVATMLSAQCTDKRINMVTPALFAAYPDAESMAKASADDIFPYIKSVSYPNVKAIHLSQMARQLMESFSGDVPSDIDSLTSLSGVGRKTANVIMAVAFEKSAMPVDTHVFRVSHRLGLVTKKANNPLKVEKELIAHFPDHLMSKAHHWLLLHGRYVCTSRSPHCRECQLEKICPKEGVEEKG